MPGAIAARGAPADRPGIEVAGKGFQLGDQRIGARHRHAADGGGGVQLRGQDRRRGFRVLQLALDQGAQMPHAAGAGQTGAFGRTQLPAPGRQHIEDAFDHQRMFALVLVRGHQRRRRLPVRRRRVLPPRRASQRMRGDARAGFAQQQFRRRAAKPARLTVARRQGNAKGGGRGIAAQPLHQLLHPDRRGATHQQTAGQHDLFQTAGRPCLVTHDRQRAGDGAGIGGGLGLSGQGPVLCRQGRVRDLAHGIGKGPAMPQTIGLRAVKGQRAPDQHARRRLGKNRIQPSGQRVGGPGGQCRRGARAPTYDLSLLAGKGEKHIILGLPGQVARSI